MFEGLLLSRQFQEYQTVNIFFSFPQMNNLGGGHGIDWVVNVTSLGSTCLINVTSMCCVRNSIKAGAFFKKSWSGFLGVGGGGGGFGPAARALCSQEKRSCWLVLALITFDTTSRSSDFLVSSPPCTPSPSTLVRFTQKDTEAKVAFLYRLNKGNATGS